jgi:hypothetical protein
MVTMLYRIPPGSRRCSTPLLLGWASRLPCFWTGLALFGSVLLPLPLSTTSLTQMQALNRELGKLCSNPPRQALNVCRIHARLVSAL